MRRSYQKGETVWYIQNGQHVESARVVSAQGDFFTLSAPNFDPTHTAFFCLRGSRLFPTEEEAKRALAEKLGRSEEIRQKPMGEEYSRSAGILASDQIPSDGVREENGKKVLYWHNERIPL